MTDQANTSQFVVAGPGTGKTTALAVRAVKLVLVDDVDPISIIATTFTRRAAGELRSRILSLADEIRRSLMSHTPGLQAPLGQIDFNRIYTGTLDSLSEEIMTDFRGPGTPPPVVIDENLSNDLMLRHGLFPNGRFRRQRLATYYRRINGTTWGMSAKGLATLVREVHDRAVYDGVDLNAFRRSRPRPGKPTIVDAINDYRNYLDSHGWQDFALLESTFLERLRSGGLDEFTREVKVLLVDEYQDTNLLQERIYFELGRHCLAHGGGIAVVGDDDQALYRFRGTTPDLFINFPHRVNSAHNVSPTTVFLSENRRSTDSIVNFVNDFARLDPSYQTIRVGNKPRLQRVRPNTTPFPVLGMFRRNLNILTRDLARMIDQIVNGNGYQIPGSRLRIRRNPNSGSSADVIFLSYSPREEDGNGNPLLPQTLRTRLGNLRRPIAVYNPRGRALHSVPEVAQLMGTILECVDPRGRIAAGMQRLPRQATSVFNSWRAESASLVRRNPPPRGPPSLRDFARAWSSRRPTNGGNWPRIEIPLLDLIYNLITWIPYFQGDLEGLAYLEAVNRTLTSAGEVGNYEAYISFTDSRNTERSVAELYWNFFVPLALDIVDVDEDLLDTLPRDRLGVFSIHQSKGLEFPMVIVDVGSSFRNNHAAHAFKRFPRDPGSTSRLEDDLRPLGGLGASSRGGLDRAFDDLVRQYFVAFSRAQDVLLLVGLDSVIQPPDIPHIGTGWIRSGDWPWRGLGRLQMI